MKSWRRLFIYLILNILVSGCATAAVLFAWDQWYGPVPRGLLSKALAQFSRPTNVPQSPAQTSAPVVAKPTATEAFKVYQVQAGDTFESIAANHNVSVEELIIVNGFTRSQALGAGEVLRIPLHPRGSVTIDSVVGAGDLDSERVLLKHSGGGELSLVGWRLEDGKGNLFIFPQSPELTLYGSGAVNIYTRAGVNTVVDLFWGLDHAVWVSGATVTLRDDQGIVRATYVVP